MSDADGYFEQDVTTLVGADGYVRYIAESEAPGTFGQERSFSST